MVATVVSTYKAATHELCTEMLNMREKSELQAALSMKTRRLEQPSLTVESEPENVLSTASPVRRDPQLVGSRLQQGHQDKRPLVQSLNNTAQNM